MRDRSSRDSEDHLASDSAHGGGYLASASDLMIGLLFIFIILVVVLAIQTQTQWRELNERIEQQQAKIEVQRKQLVGSGDPLVFVTKRLGEGLQGVLPNIRVDQATGVLSLPEQVLFPRGSSDLSSAGARALAAAAEFLSSEMLCYVENRHHGRDCSNNPLGHRIETIFIEGHTDSVPFAAGPRDNFDLSLARARAVERAMVSNSPLSEFRNRSGQPLFSFSAYADTRPIKGTDPADAQNRRVDLRIVLSYRPIEELMPGLRQSLSTP